jgi:hypothetical protein
MVAPPSHRPLTHWSFACFVRVWYWIALQKYVCNNQHLIEFVLSSFLHSPFLCLSRVCWASCRSHSCCLFLLMCHSCCPPFSQCAILNLSLALSVLHHLPSLLLSLTFLSLMLSSQCMSASEVSTHQFTQHLSQPLSSLSCHTDVFSPCCCCFYRE